MSNENMISATEIRGTRTNVRCGHCKHPLVCRLVHLKEIAVNRQSVISAARVAAPWVAALLLILIFAPQGFAKFSDSSGWATAFRIWGYPVWFRITIGVIELLAVVLLLWGRTAAVGAVLIICVMLGAMGTHLALENGRHMTSEIVPLTLATIVLILRRKELARLVSGRIRAE
jgi:putative oxidoreductase